MKYNNNLLFKIKGRLARSEGSSAVLRIADQFDPFLNEYYFDRRSTYFPDILALYQTGSLHMTSNPLPPSLSYPITDILVDGCRIAFMEELNFWDIDEMLLETCCHQVL